MFKCPLHVIIERINRIVYFFAVLCAHILNRFAVSLSHIKLNNFISMVFDYLVDNIVSFDLCPIKYRLISFFVVPQILGDSSVKVKSSNVFRYNLQNIFRSNRFSVCICNFSPISAFYKVLQTFIVHCLPAFYTNIIPELQFLSGMSFLSTSPVST